MAIPYKVEENLLTNPSSYSVRFVSKGSSGREHIAAEIALRHPNFSKKDILTLLDTEDEVIGMLLLKGEQVTKEGCCTWFPSFTARLKSEDEPLPPLTKCLNINVRVSAPFIENLRKNAQAERLPASEKVPIIKSTEDTVLGLNDVLRSDGMLRIMGGNLQFNRTDSRQHCLIEGTRSGSAVQSRVGTVTNSEIVLMPDVPSQEAPWNNEYRLSLTTRYTRHGSLRTGIYKRRLRSPLSVVGLGTGEETGILTDNATAPYVSVVEGNVTADTTLRIHVFQDLSKEVLLFSLLALEEDGATGVEVAVSANGTYTLPGFNGSAVASLTVRVDDYIALWDMLRNDYSGRLKDVLVFSVG